MRFQFTAAFTLLLLNSVASSFGSNNLETIHHRSFSSSGSSSRIPFVSRGGNNNIVGTTISRMSTSVDCVTAKEISSDNLELLSERGRSAILSLIESDKEGFQRHVYGNWPESGIEDEGKIHLGEQLADLDSSYPGGIAIYTSKARILLRESAEGSNPFEDFVAVVPEGETLSYDGKGTMSFSEAERLGYSGIKLSLETNLCTEVSYLQLYIKYIKAMQNLARKKTGRDDIRLPLVIMTSGDTDMPTRQLLKDNDNFGMDEDMISIVMQDKVPALKDANAALALDDNSR